MTVKVIGEFKTGLWNKIRNQVYTLEVRGIRIPLNWEELIEIQNKINYEISSGIKSSVDIAVNEILNRLDFKFSIENLEPLLRKNFSVELCSNCKIRSRHNLKHEGESSLLCQECERCCNIGLKEKKE